MNRPNYRSTDVSITHSKVIQFRVANQSIINYCYAFIDLITRDAVVIDPAWNPLIIINTLAQYDARLKGILVTHHHFDHTDLANYLAMYFGIDIYISTQEARMYNTNLNNMQLFNNDALITLGNIPIRTILTPGHTSGSCCFLIDNNLFTGDTLFNEGCGLCTGYGASAYAMFDSLKKIKSIALPDTLIYPGHRFATPLGKTFSEITKINIYLNIDNIELFVKYRMRIPRSGLITFK